MRSNVEFGGREEGSVNEGGAAYSLEVERSDRGYNCQRGGATYRLEVERKGASTKESNLRNMPSKDFSGAMQSHMLPE
jgi:hypothetical protein